MKNTVRIIVSFIVTFSLLGCSNFTEDLGFGDNKNSPTVNSSETSTANSTATPSEKEKTTTTNKRKKILQKATATNTYNFEQLLKTSEQFCEIVEIEGWGIGKDGHPYSESAPYEPKTLFNPIAVANFNNAVRKSEEFSDELKQCWAEKTVSMLLVYSEVAIHDGIVSRFYPYEFPFKPNPSVPEMSSGWVSGLGQGAVLGTIWSTSKQFSNRELLKYVAETYESFFVPIEDGGFLNILTDEKIWFEEYPSDPPTTVLNGMNYAAIAFAQWTKETADPRGEAYIPKIVESYKNLLPMFEIEDEGGVLATYDLVRGMGTENKLRFAKISRNSENGSSPKEIPVTIHDKPQTIPLVISQTSENWKQNGSFLKNSNFDKGFENWVQVGVKASVSDGVARVPSSGELSGFSQTVSSDELIDVVGDLSLEFDFRRVENELLNDGGEHSATVSVFEKCGEDYSTLGNMAYPRSNNWGTYRFSFPKTSINCDLVVQFLFNGKVDDGTVLEFRKISLIEAEDSSVSVVPQYNHHVIDFPETFVRFAEGFESFEQGFYELQVYVGGRWVTIDNFYAGLSGDVSGVDESGFRILERFTGRNINYNYHNHHTYEMVALSKVFDDPVFLEYASRWDAMSLGYKVP